MSEIPITSIADLIRDRAEALPDLDVLTFEHEGAVEVRTYAQLWEHGRRLAGALARLGLERGDRFGLLLRNHPEFVEAMVASALLGAPFVPIDPRTRGEKLAFLLRHSRCRGVICGKDAEGAALDCAGAVPDLSWLLVVGDPGSVPAGARTPTVRGLDEMIAGHVPDVPVVATDPTDPMQIMYTSGTTGDPKGVVVRHARFALVAGHGETVFSYRPGDRPYTGLSLTHGNAQFVTLAPALAMGLRTVLSRGFTKSRLWDIVRTHDCTSFSLLGGMATAIYSEPPRADDADNPVRHVISAGMPGPIWREFSDRFGVDVLEFYAAVEGGMTIKPIGEGPIGSCGKVAPGLEARIVDPDGNDVPTGSPGEIWFRPADGSPAAVEYVDDPEASRRKTEGGWLHSGDVVRMDADGWVFFEHRVGGGIRRNGEFIQPELVAKVVAEHPSVDDVVVYGVPATSGAAGEKDVVAAVVPADPTAFDPGEILAWCAQRLEPNAVPSLLQLVDAVPKTASEKPQERFLIELLEEEPERVFRPEMAHDQKPER